MKRIVMYILLLGAALAVPVCGVDVGELLPVEVVQVYREGDYHVIATDVEAVGAGETIEDAIINLKESAAGMIYLDTANFLLIDESSKENVQELKDYLKPSVRVCIAGCEIEPEKVARFLRVHTPVLRLKDVSGENLAQKLLQEEKGYIFKNFEKRY